MKPNKLPMPDFRASLLLARPISSPMNAPKNGPKMSPIGKYDSPITVPMKLPHFPYLVPPKYFTPKDGIM